MKVQHLFKYLKVNVSSRPINKLHPVVTTEQFIHRGVGSELKRSLGELGYPIQI